jgi:hypothetical protein
VTTPALKDKLDSGAACAMAPVEASKDAPANKIGKESFFMEGSCKGSRR